MKVAVATNDGKTVSQDLGSAKFFLIFALNRSKPAGRELRLKPRMVSSKWGPPSFGVGGLEKEVAECVMDCQLLVSGGMKREQREGLMRLGKRAILTDLVFVDDVLLASAKGTLGDHPERLS